MYIYGVYKNKYQTIENVAIQSYHIKFMLSKHFIRKKLIN